MQDRPVSELLEMIFLGIAKVLWYLLIAAIAIMWFLISLALDASKPSKNNYC